jgi:hypothetical protein
MALNGLSKDAMTYSLKAFCLTTPNITLLSFYCKICCNTQQYDIQHNNMPSVTFLCCFAKCHYAECYYAECHGAKVRAIN